MLSPVAGGPRLLASHSAYHLSHNIPPHLVNMGKQLVVYIRSNKTFTPHSSLSYVAVHWKQEKIWTLVNRVIFILEACHLCIQASWISVARTKPLTTLTHNVEHGNLGGLIRSVRVDYTIWLEDHCSRRQGDSLCRLSHRRRVVQQLWILPKVCFWFFPCVFSWVFWVIPMRMRRQGTHP